MVPLGASGTSTLVAPAEAAPTPVRVVVIDDRQDRRQIMRHVVELSDKSVSVVGFADSCDTAVQAVDRLDANAVLLEIQLPISEGLAAISALRDDRPGLRIVVCSFHNDSQTREAALARGADAYLTKPLSPRDLYPLRSASPDGFGRSQP